MGVEVVATGEGEGQGQAYLVRVRVRVRVLTRGERRTTLVAGVVLAEGAPCWPDAVGACSVSCSMRPPPSPGSGSG